MARSTYNGLLRIYYAKLSRNRTQGKVRRQKKLTYELLGRNTEKGLLSIYYRKWLQAQANGAEKRQKNQIAENERILAELEEKYKEMEARIVRTKKLNERLDEKARLEKLKVERLRRIAELEQSLKDLAEKIKNKSLAEKSRHDTQQQLIETMSLLKCRALNFDSDYGLIMKTVDRANSTDRGDARMFLTSHMDVKRSVVQTLGEQPKKKDVNDTTTDLTYTWGKTDASVRTAVSKFPTHTHNVIVEAIKKMVIAFDIMKPEHLDDLETDEEIVANATGLITMFDYILEVKAKKAAGLKQKSL